MSLKRVIYNHLPLALKSIVFKKRMMDTICGYDKTFRVMLNEAFDTYLSENERKDKPTIRKLTEDIVKCWLQYKALPYEYFLFNFRKLNANERWEFETDMDRIDTLCKITPPKVFMEEIKNKYNFYLMTKAYFKRNAIKIDNQSSVDEFVDFIHKQRSVFIKPLDTSKGEGSRSFAYIDDESSRRCFSELLEEHPAWIIEERICQAAEMAQWNESSVNTVRVPTFLCNGKFTVIWTRMRTGKKGAIVDNLGSNGIVVSVDPQSGTVTSDGVDNSNNHFEIHPDSGLKFKGWQVPRWAELLQTAEELHRKVFGKHVYIAWDFALTDNGWVLVEGNWGQLLGQQTTTQIGLRRKFHELVGDHV
ncbi:MAG: hypothetical protein IKX30_12850 [Victivallales bacterium]|nr:hypothetical protein [Victivallales bacterium]